MLEAVSNKVAFSEQELEVLSFWEREEIFKKSLEQTRGNREYVFYDGPPFATGKPHYGHLLAGTIKDIVPRYQTMRGHYVARRFGWDCHGLPIEALAQEALGLSGTAAIVELGVDAFNEQCRSMVQGYVTDWRETVTRMGRWVDFDNDYKTMDLTYMETIWWVFQQLWEQKRIYRAHRIMPYSWKLTTPLSNFEANSNYQDVQDPAITVRLRITSPTPWEGEVYALAWTTTPWTLPENLALCAGPGIEYSALRDAASGEVYVLATARLETYYRKPEEYTVLGTLTGAELAEWAYEPLFPYFADQPNSFRILNDDFVSTEEGTGLVHMAPAYGEDDYRICRAAGIELVDPLDDECNFTDVLPEYAGQFCKDADKALIRRLKDEGKLVHQSTIQHSYPFCERTDTPLIYRAIEAWYVSVEDLRGELSAENDAIHWVPGYVGSKRFGNWLREAKDWNISRNRFWGSCIPLWINTEDPDDMICVGSVDELEQLSGVRVDDLHKHVVDQVVIQKDGKTYKRTPEVLDCWFESGAMPYAQQHYPFERKGEETTFFPADFIAEGLDQTRGWFYTLLVLSTMLFKKSCYRNVVVNGLVLAEDGRKMSKRLKNYPDPMYMLNQYGADALRLYLVNSPVVRAEDLCFTEAGVRQSARHLLIPWWNAYAFFVTYARIDGWTPDQIQPGETDNVLDRWILSTLERLCLDVTGAMDTYDLQRSVRPFVQFIEELTNWYIRRSRRRFWKSSDDSDKQQAYATLYTVLLKLSRISAPFVPFISESIYRNLRTDDMPESVHLCSFPEGNEAARDLELEKQMQDAMIICTLGRQLRTDYNRKVRQPLSVLHVVCRDIQRLQHAETLAEILQDELNVKEVRCDPDEGALARYSAKPNFKVLGPRLGRNVKLAAPAIAALDHAALDELLNGGTQDIQIGDQGMALTADDIVIERVPIEGLAVSSEAGLIVGLELDLSPELEQEGLARELVSKVQNLRKVAAFEVTARIRMELQAPDEVWAALDAYRDYVLGEILCTACEKGPAEEGEELDLNGHLVRVHLIEQKTTSA